MSNTCPHGHKIQTAEHTKQVAYLDADGMPQKIAREHWIVWTCQINTLEHRIELGLTSCYHTAAEGCHPNLDAPDKQMTHITLVNKIDRSLNRNPWTELLATVDGNAFAISPQVVLDYIASVGILPTVPEDG